MAQEGPGQKEGREILTSAVNRNLESPTKSSKNSRLLPRAQGTSSRWDPGLKQGIKDLQWDQFSGSDELGKGKE